MGGGFVSGLLGSIGDSLNVKKQREHAEDWQLRQVQIEALINADLQGRVTNREEYAKALEDLIQPEKGKGKGIKGKAQQAGAGIGEKIATATSVVGQLMKRGQQPQAQAQGQTAGPTPGYPMSTPPTFPSERDRDRAAPSPAPSTGQMPQLRTGFGKIVSQLKPVPQPASQMDLEKMRLEGQRETQRMIQEDITERSRERAASEERMAKERIQERWETLQQNLAVQRERIQAQLEIAKQNSIDRNLAEKDRQFWRMQMMQLKKEQSEGDPSAWAQLVKTGQAKLSDIPDKATRNRVAESAVKEGWGIPVKLPAADAKSVRDADTFVTQIDKILAMLEPVKNDNTPAYLPGGKGPGVSDRAAYSAGRRTQWSDYISFSERGAVQTVTGFLRGTRNQKWIDRILVHTPHTWTDSPANAYGKLQAMKESLQDMKREITGGKDVQLVGDRLVETTTAPQTPQVLNYDKNGNLIQ